MVTQHREVERKYEIPAEAVDAIDPSTLDGLSADEPVTHRLSATYYDTADGALSAAKVAVRRRCGGSDDGWHVKYQAGAARGELHAEPLKTSDRMPAALRKTLTGLTLGAELEALATIETERTVYPVRDADGTAVAELCVDAVRATDERTGLVRTWRECEVELNETITDEETAAAVFDALETLLFDAGATVSASRAKIARALGEDDDAGTVTVLNPRDAAPEGEREDEREDERADDASGKPGKTKKSGKSGKSGTSGRSGKSGKSGKPGKPDKAGKSGKNRKREKKAARAAATLTEPTENTETSEPTGADVLAGMCAWLVRQLQQWDFAVRVDTPDAVHQMRVRTRALRSVLHAARDYVPSAVGSELDQRLKTLSRALSDARDEEVAAQELAAVIDHDVPLLVPGTVRDQLQRAGEDAAEVAARSVRRALDSADHVVLLRQLHEFVAQRPFEAAAALSAKKFAKRVLGTALQDVIDRAEPPARERDQDDTTREDGGAHEPSPLAQDLATRLTLPGCDAAEVARRFDVLHSARKAIKAVRYVQEALEREGVKAGSKRSKAARHAEDFQDALGTVTDRAVLETWLAATARSFQRTGTDRYAVGVLHGLCLARLREDVLDAPGVLEALVAEIQTELHG